MKKKTNVKCEKCGYEWFTNSERRRVACPSCNHSTLNPQYVERGF